MSRTLVLETRTQENESPLIGDILSFTPPIRPDYWRYRVRLTDTQAMLGFPKFSTIGIGFEREDADWNTNLPYHTEPEEIFDHIKHNKSDDSISDEECIAAIRMIQQAVTEGQI